MHTRKHAYDSEENLAKSGENLTVQHAKNGLLTAQTYLKNGEIHSINSEQNLPQQKRRRSAPIFEYPALPEIKLCFAIAIGTIIYGWYCVFNASQKWKIENDGLFLTISNLPPLVGNFLGLKDDVCKF